MKVLIVDDEPLVRLSLRRALERRGHQVDECEDGQMALERWGTLSPELVFLDVLMPRLSGPDLLRAMTAQDRGRAKVVLMSAFAGEYDLERARSLGADLFIAKPFEDIFSVVKSGEDLLSGAN
ncbi:MAG: response regulator [Bdellovibrionales bacterium]